MTMIALYTSHSFSLCFSSISSLHNQVGVQTLFLNNNGNMDETELLFCLRRPL